MTDRISNPSQRLGSKGPVHAIAKEVRPVSTLRTIDETAEFPNKTRRSGRRLVDSDELPVHRRGRSVRISEADISRTQFPSDTDTESAVFGRARGGRQRNGYFKFFTIVEVAERLVVSRRSVRRWITAGDLIAHRIGGIVRIAESDFRAFLAVHREG
jgi:excisionase family DNA binding protein